MREAAQAYAHEVREHTFPAEAQSAKMDAAVLAALRDEQPQTSAPAATPESQPAESHADGYAPPKKGIRR